MKKIIVLSIMMCSSFSLSAMDTDRFAPDAEEIASILAPLNSLQLNAALSDEEIAARLASLPGKPIPPEIVKTASFDENNDFKRGEIILVSWGSSAHPCYFYACATREKYYEKMHNGPTFSRVSYVNKFGGSSLGGATSARYVGKLVTQPKS